MAPPYIPAVAKTKLWDRNSTGCFGEVSEFPAKFPQLSHFLATTARTKGKRPLLELEELPEATEESERASKAVKTGGKKKRTPRLKTPLQRFRAQTILKRRQLAAERKRIDRELKSIEKDLGILKRKVIIKD